MRIEVPFSQTDRHRRHFNQFVVLDISDRFLERHFLRRREIDGIVLALDGGGVKAVDIDGNDLGGHQAFWFAWSQFYPGTELWPGE